MEPLIIGEIGSYAHGLNTADSDHDYIGLYADTPETLIGINPASSRATKIRDKPAGVKSEAGDTETTLYSLRHYTSLAAQGNPTLMTLLFTPTLPHPDTIGLQANSDMFLSKRLVARHIGYADNMTARLTGGKAPRTNRPELVAAHGYDCYLSDTEFLTERGWLRYDDIDDGDLLATIDQTTGSIVYQRMLSRVSKPYSGDLISHRSHFSEWSVTANHRMFVAKMNRGPCGINPSTYTAERAEAWGFRRADQITSVNWYQRVAAAPTRHEYPVTDAYLALVGAYTSEGCVTKRLSDGTASVLAFSQADGGPLHATIDAIRTEYTLRQYNYLPRAGNRKASKVWTLANRTVANDIAKSCGEGSVNKRLPDWVRHLSSRQAEILIAALMSGDGTIDQHGISVYYTKSKRLADDIQTLAISNGRRCTITGPYADAQMYHVRIQNPGIEVLPFQGGQLKVERVVNAQVVCFTVPNETLITRRNGRVAMHGNTKAAFHAVRLLIQGHEMLTAHTMRMPMSEGNRAYLMSMRRGEIPKDEALAAIAAYRSAIIKAATQTTLPDHPDYDRINRWLIETHHQQWEQSSTASAACSVA